MDINYINAILLSILVIAIAKLMLKILEYLEDFYDDCYRKWKQINEKIFNDRLEKNIIKQETQISNYMLYIKIKPSNSHKNIRAVKDIDINQQYQVVQKYITDRVLVDSIVKYQDGFIYYFNNFDSVDNTINLLDKIKKMTSLYSYIFCIQIGNDINQLKKMIDLQIWGKIVICADTLLRYNYNKIHRYKATNIGIFQKNNSIIEVYEINVEE